MALLIDQHLPTRRVMRHKSDKPCVTDYFRQIIRKQHRAFLFANNSLYRSLRNKVIRSAKSIPQSSIRSNFVLCETVTHADAGGSILRPLTALEYFLRPACNG